MPEDKPNVLNDRHVQSLLLFGIIVALILAGVMCWLATNASNDLRLVYMTIVGILLFSSSIGVFLNLRRSSRLNINLEQDSGIIEDRLKSIYDTIQDGLIIMNESGSILSLNRSTERIFGYRQSELLNAPVTKLMPSKEARRHQDYVEKYMDTGQKTIIGRGRQVTALRADGVEIPVFLTVNEFAHRGKNGERIFVGVLRDLSQLSASEARVEELSRRLLQVQEDERSQLSALIHDEVGQMLFAVKLSLQSLFSDIQNNVKIDVKNTEEILSYMTQVISDVRQISHSISPIRLKSLGLAKAIAELTESMAGKNNVEVKLNVEHIDQFFQDGWDINVYRVVQEAIINSIKHAGAKLIQVRSWIDSENLFLEIEDDGTGFYPEGKNAGTGLGLSLMQQRALLAGGQLSIQSSYETGTRILLSIDRGILK